MAANQRRLFICGLGIFFLALKSVTAAVGGGYTACGLKGEYFPTHDLSGPAAFVRQDNRIMFDWAEKAPVGGSNTPSFRNFPADGISIRWTGKLISRFSENYTFTADTNQWVRVWINNKPVIDRWSKGDTAQTKPVALKAGESYDIRVEFRKETGAAKMALRWSSPSTADEVIDPVSVNGINLASCESVLFADEIKYCQVEPTNAFACIWFTLQDPVRGPPLTPDQVDANLWPKQDALIRVDPYWRTGNYELQFSGKAEVHCQQRWGSTPGTFTVAGQTYPGTLPAGTGYNAATNTTTALVQFPSLKNGSGTQNLIFTSTQRTGDAQPNSGITNLHLMRPQAQTADATPCAEGTIAFPAAKDVLQNYTVYRYFSDAFADERTWSERTLPTMPSFTGSPPMRDTSSKPSWEYLTMYANEMGKDLYISISATADHDYYAKLANLIKYGSDGVNPYTSTAQWPATGPVYPPLNSNLRFYIEYSNEVWNFGFHQYAMARDACNDAIAKNTPDGQIVNYDGQGNNSWDRWQDVQTVNISNAFRSVFGDAAMGDKIRVLLFDRYGAFGRDSGQFLDNYFNKSDPKSTFAGPPHPVSYYIWGGGGAIYYGSTHPTGIDPDTQFQDGGFEKPELADGAVTVNPPGGSWTFTGNAGIYRNIARQQAMTAQPAATATTPKQKSWVGFKFTVGDKPLYVYNIGRMTAKNNAQPHDLQIFSVDGNGLLVDQVVTLDKPAQEYVWTRTIEPGWTRNLVLPLRLEPHTSYYAMSSEQSDDYLAPASVQPSPDLTVDGGATATPDGKPTFTTTPTPNTSAGPINFRYAVIPQDKLGFTCDAPEGQQVAFIGDTGAISQTIHFAKAGTYSIGFYCAGKKDALAPVTFTMDGAKITPLGGDNPLWQASEDAWEPGGFERRADDLAIWWGTATFKIDQPGDHQFQVQGSGKDGEYLYFDGFKILSPEGIYGPDCSYFPSMGEANGQDPRGGLDNFIQTLHDENNWVTAWGLKTMAYEGGWSVGGDFDQKPIHSYCKFVAPGTIDADAKAINVYTNGGGALFCYFYAQWPQDSIDTALKCPLVQAVIKRNDFLPAETNYGALVPGNLSPNSNTLLSAANADSTGNLAGQNGWIDWNIIAPETQTYDVVADIGDSKGSYAIRVDDAHALGVAGDPNGIKLTKGQHSIKIVNTGTTPVTVKNIAVTIPGAPTAPVLNSTQFEKGQCSLAWAAVPSASGYVIYYGTTSGNYTSSLKTGAVTNVTIPNLDNDGVYYFTCQAIDAKDRLSPASNEVRTAHRSTNPQALVDFEDQPVHTGPVEVKTTIFDEQNYRFTSLGNEPALIIEGPENLWPSKILYSPFWGIGQTIQRTDLKPFDLYSIDLCANPGTGSATITGFDPSGASFKKSVNFTFEPNKVLVMPVVLDLVHVTKVHIQWWAQPDGAGGQGRCGGIDNVLFNKTPKAGP